MKIGMENFSIKDSQFERDKKVSRVSSSEKADRQDTEILIKNSNHSIKDAYLNIQRSISEAQTRITSFLSVRERIQESETYSEEENEQFLKTLINNAQIKGEKVLQPYEAEIASVLQKSDMENIDNMIKSAESEIEGLSARIDSIDQLKNNAEQNLLAVKNNLKDNNIDTLMNNVISQIKQSDVPGLNLTREKIIDLL